MCLLILIDFGCPGDHFGGHFGVLEHPKAPRITPWIPRCLLGAIWMIFRTFRWRKASPLFNTLSICWCLFVTFCCSSEQVSQKDSQKGLPGGPQEGSRLDVSSFFTFAAEPKKDSKMGAKMERFGSPKSPLYYFLEDFLRADFEVIFGRGPRSICNLQAAASGSQGRGLGGGENSLRREREGSETAMARWAAG